ncbi:hypothetical protein [Lactococcus lactis]|uniref:hypothetical protein n=1 Tax=Lactococcus lactis TaxID=1358 RepID=UPI00071E6427|nr:hypothetical protein [Lactococcus lactis]MRM49943.1 hypothetical protein [Lactococcus cremoris]ARE01446.1 prophage protein [Lactococcus lactis subsp. lactis]ARE03793.1 prophage protein [Lactococcus lactis subsp. lactis]KSU23992.1 Phage protein [Lactococcus lactis subsp. lactis]MCT3110765.1 hypothetical protein [Lactococcus lactis]
MSELEKTAPNEIYLIVGDADKDCNFNELAEVTWADKPVYEETAVKYVKSSQLTIPKSIADMLYEELNPLKRESMIETFVLGVNYLVLSDELMKFVITGDNYHIICAYLAGKALGVDLVKVVADD